MYIAMLLTWRHSDMGANAWALELGRLTCRHSNLSSDLRYLYGLKWVICLSQASVSSCETGRLTALQYGSEYKISIVPGPMLHHT